MPVDDALNPLNCQRSRPVAGSVQLIHEREVGMKLAKQALRTRDRLDVSNQLRERVQLPAEKASRFDTLDDEVRDSGPNLRRSQGTSEILVWEIRSEERRAGK